MIKPLLHTIPALSGNITLACSLNDYVRIGDTIECHVRTAKLAPLSHELAIKKCEISLLTSSYEFDIKKFFSSYSNYFYDSLFSYSKKDYTEFVSEESMNYRDKDFEFGTKRISSEFNEGNTFAFFAPFWCDSVDDLPDYFLIEIKVDSPSYDLTKKVKVLIKDYDPSYRYNYLSKYLKRYFSQIDSNVIFCRPGDNQATYYGIDLLRGGFARAVDNIIGQNYVWQSSINKFDENIVNGFRRNKLCIKQVMPISFYFNINDFFTAEELNRFRQSQIIVSGNWYKNEKRLPFYDFSTEYDYFTQKVWNFKSNGVFDYVESKQNIMDVDYPSLNEARQINYQYFNTLPKNVARWKLKYSDDENPYITNMSFAFSAIQGSANKYREFPSIYAVSNGFCDHRNNLVIPKESALNDPDSLYSKNDRALLRYQKAMLSNSSNWFDVINETEWYEKYKVINEKQFNDKKGQWYKKGTALDILTDYSGFKESECASITPDNEPIDVYVKLSDDETFTVSTELYIKHTIFDNDYHWSDVIDNKVYVNGILYDLSKIYKENPDTPKIDKFGVFVKPILNPISSDDLNELKTASWSILSNKKNIHNANAFLSPDIKEMLVGAPMEDIRNLFINETGIGKQLNEVAHDTLYIKNTSQEDGEFINLHELGYDTFEINKYYKISEILADGNVSDLNKQIIESSASKYWINGFEMLPIYRLSQIASGTDFMFSKHKLTTAKWIYENLYFSERTNYSKSKYDKNTFKKLSKNKPFAKLENLLYLNNNFISAYDFAYLTTEGTTTTASEYSFNPIIVDSNEIIASNVFKKVNSYIGRNYGDLLPEAKIKNDLELIYVDLYNLRNALGTSFKQSWTSNEDMYEELYCKLISISHLRTYLIELYQNEDKNSSENPLENLYIKKRIFINDKEINDISIKDIFVSVSEIYESVYGSLTEYMTVENLIHDFVFDNGTWSFSDDFINRNKELLNSLFDNIYDKQETFKFELVFYKKFIKLNDTIWSHIKIENEKEYRDFYLYKISREKDYSKEFKYFYSEDPYNENYVDTSKTIEPLFNEIWLQDRNVTTIYREWQQNKISEVTVEGQEYKFYRYDCDNIPVMYELSNFDTKHTYIVSNNSYWLSYSYINNLISNEELTEEQILIDDRYKHLPTWNKIKGGSSNIVLANGNVPVLKYYSAYSYNYLGVQSYVSTSYYSDYSHGRIDFDDLEELGIYHTDSTTNNHYDNENEYDPVSYHTETFTTNVLDIMTYNWIKSKYMQKPVYYNSLGLYDKYKISSYIVRYVDVVPQSYVSYKNESVLNSDGITSTNVVTYSSGVRYKEVEKTTTYGMLWIESEFDNTNSSLNIVDTNGNDKKYFSYIDKYDIYDDKFEISSKFKDIVPFSKIYLRETLNSSEFVVKPSMFNISNYYKPVENTLGYTSTYYSTRPFGTMSLERYFDSITPYLPETKYVTSYSLKHKSSPKTMLKTTVNTVLYKDKSSIWEHSKPRLYKNENEYELINETELKHFNDSRFINLEKEITINLGDRLLYSEVIEKEKPENVLKEFSAYIRQFLDIDDSGILFLYNKYTIKYDSYPNGIDYSRLNKVYSLKLKFILK